jgi:hypothetical protein
MYKQRMQSNHYYIKNPENMLQHVCTRCFPELGMWIGGPKGIHIFTTFFSSTNCTWFPKWAFWETSTICTTKETWWMPLGSPIHIPKKFIPNVPLHIKYHGMSVEHIFTFCRRMKEVDVKFYVGFFLLLHVEHQNISECWWSHITSSLLVHSGSQS